MPELPPAGARLQGRYGAAAQALVDAAHEGELACIPGTETIWAQLRWAARRRRVQAGRPAAAPHPHRHPVARRRHRHPAAHPQHLPAGTRLERPAMGRRAPRLPGPVGRTLQPK
jgi:hypothetical protein